MLTSNNRLTKDSDFKRIKTFGRSFFSSLFRLRYLANNLLLSRFAVVVSTKISKKATQRNRLKRQIREIIRLNQSRVKSGYDVVISASGRALGKDYQELEQAVLAILAKANLIK